MVILREITEIDFQDYKLSAQLRGHDDEVRRICLCGNAGFATSSRDKTVKFWSLDESNKYSLQKTMVGHTSSVGAIAWVPPFQGFPEGAIVSGGDDTLVMGWDLESGELRGVLRGHSMEVTGIAVDGLDIVTSSVDRTLKRWRKGKLVDSWEAHQSPVQAVIKLPSGELATGSSDTTLKLWRGKTCVDTFTGHNDTVQGLAVMSDSGVLSASHDRSARLWALTGQVSKEMVGHASSVYSVASRAGLVASGSEDCTAKLWKDGILVQSINHPGRIFDVKFLANGNLITACSDGVVRIWTTHGDRAIDPLEHEAYLSELSDYESSRNTNTVGGLEEEEESLQALDLNSEYEFVHNEGDPEWMGEMKEFFDLGKDPSVINVYLCNSNIKISSREQGWLLKEQGGLMAGRVSRRLNYLSQLAMHLVHHTPAPNSVDLFYYFTAGHVHPHNFLQVLEYFSSFNWTDWVPFLYKKAMKLLGLEDAISDS